MKALNVFYTRITHMTNVLQLENNEMKGWESFLLLSICIFFNSTQDWHSCPHH
jgi:hypothetical protein